MTSLPQFPRRAQIDVERVCAGPATALAAALYDAFPALDGCSQVISIRGRARVSTYATVDADAVIAFIRGYIEGNYETMLRSSRDSEAVEVAHA